MGITLGDAAKEYLRHFAKRNRPNSVSRYRKALDHFEGFVGADLPLNSLDVATVQDYQLHRSPQVEPRTVDYEVDVLRALLNWYRRRRWVRENVASKELVERLYRPTGKESEARRVFTDEELRLLLDYDDPKWPDAGAILATLYYTGMRIGELGHLTRKDVRLGKRLVRIRSKELRVPVRGKRDPQQVEWVPKWGSERVIPIEERLAPVLERFERVRQENIWGLYFMSRTGYQVSDHLSRLIQSITKKKDVSVHTFRHTHITHALNRWGRNPSIVQRWVGHRDLATTQRYLHVGIDDLVREAGKVGE